MTISSQIIEIINDLCAKFGMVIDWSEENVLPYVQTLLAKFISWEIATSLAWIGIALFAILFGIVLIICDQKVLETEICTVVSIVVMGIALLVIGTQIFDIIECKVFPEKTIYDYVSMLISRQRGF